MSSQRYERVRYRHPSLAAQSIKREEHTANSHLQVSANDEESLISPQIPTSPPPSFRSHASSPTRHIRTVDQNLADTFDADESDSDEENDGDDRQRLMRGTPSSSSTEQLNTNSTTSETPRPPVIERRLTHLPEFAPPRPTGRVYGGGSGSDGVFANLSAKPEAGEKTEEHPPVSILTYFGDNSMLTDPIDIRTSCCRCSTTVLGNHNSCTRPRRPRRSVRRRPTCRIRILFHLERHDLDVLPTRRFPPHLSSPHYTRSQEWISSRSWYHSCPLRILYERIRRLIWSFERPRSPIFATRGPKQPQF
jgi:hypothetical protein